MELADEIQKLKQLHDNGALTDAEFAQAKSALLAGSTESRRSAPLRHPGDDTIGSAAKKWVNFQIVMAVVGIVVALIFFFGFFLPTWNRNRDEFDRRRDDFDRRWNEAHNPK